MNAQDVSDQGVPCGIGAPVRACLAAAGAVPKLAFAVVFLPTIANAELVYDNHTLDTGEAKSQTLLHGRLTGRDTDDLVVFSHDEGFRRMAVYSFEAGSWRLGHTAEVPDGVIFVDVMGLDGRDRLLTFSRGDIHWLDPVDWTPKPLVSASSMYHVAPRNVPRLDVARDLNGDGLDDIALPGFDGYAVWLQRPDGSLAGPSGLRVRPTANTGFRSATYRAREVYRFDHDGDGLVDLAFWDRDRMVVYPGNDSGFDTDPVTLAAPLDLSTDDVTVTFAFGGDIDETRSLLYAVEDFNGDGIGDIVTHTLDIGGLFDQSTRYDYHFGRREGGVTVFDPTPDTSISSDSVQGPLERSDFDGDGRVDFGMLSFKLGIGKIISLLLTGSVSFNMNFYLMGEGGYPEKPNVQRRVKLRIDLGSGRVAGNWVSVGDLTGDAVKDLLVQVDANRFHVYPGTGGTDLFAKQAIEIDVDLSDQGSVRLADLNGDGREDMFMSYRHPDGDSYRVGVALSR